MFEENKEKVFLSRFKRWSEKQGLIGLLIGFALQPERVPFFSVLVIPTRENTPRPEPGVCGCGPKICGEPSASQGQWSDTASEGAARCRGVYVHDSLPWSTWGFSGDYRSCRAAQIVARRFWAHSSTSENLSMEFRGRVIPEPWPIPPVRNPLEMEACLLDSGVQKLLGTEELAGGRTDEQSAASMGSSNRISECREVVRTQLLRDSTRSCWEPRHFCSACKSGC